MPRKSKKKNQTQENQQINKPKTWVDMFSHSSLSPSSSQNIENPCKQAINTNDSYESLVPNLPKFEDLSPKAEKLVKA